MSQPPPPAPDPWTNPSPVGSPPPGHSSPHTGPTHGYPLNPYQQGHPQPPPPAYGPHSAQQPYAALPPPGSPPPYGAWPGYGPQPYGAAPGVYSEKTKVAAGLLQLLPGFFLALGGIGRCYSGHVTPGVLHLVLSVLGWLLAPFGIGFLLVGASWLWAVIDGIVLLAGRPTDPYGRLLR